MEMQDTGDAQEEAAKMEQEIPSLISQNEW